MVRWPRTGDSSSHVKSCMTRRPLRMHDTNGTYENGIIVMTGHENGNNEHEMRRFIHTIR